MSITVIKLSLAQKEKCQFELNRLFDDMFYGKPLTEEHMSNVAMKFYCFFWCNGLGYLIPDIRLHTTVTEKSVTHRLYNERDREYLVKRDDYQKIANRLLVDVYKHHWGLND